jgi:hypothetical protein
MSKLVDITGKAFGILTAIHKARNRNGDTYWVCHCDCGKEIEVRTDHLRANKIRSCGCVKGKLITEKKTKHGMTHTHLYGVWAKMIQRCENPRDAEARLYYERGIKVCSGWHKFEVFAEWAFENGYSEKLTIDRRDNNGNYEPDNCRWTDLITQANNKRTNRRIEFNGEIKTLAQWAREYQIDYRKLWLRLKRGWDFERAVTEESAA